MTPIESTRPNSIENPTTQVFDEMFAFLLLLTAKEWYFVVQK